MQGGVCWTIAVMEKKPCPASHTVGDGLCAVPQTSRLVRHENRRTPSAPLLGELSAKLTEGSPVYRNCQWKKNVQCIENLCHSEERSDVGIRFSLGRKYVLARCEGDADCHSPPEV